MKRRTDQGGLARHARSNHLWRPEFAELFGAVESPTDNYRAAIVRNIQDSDGTIWFGDIGSPGFKTTRNIAVRRSPEYPFLVLYTHATRPSDVAEWLRANKISILNVSGNSELSNPGVGERVERFMLAVLRKLTEG